MIELLDRKIRQMHEALGQLQSADLSTIQPEYQCTSHTYYCKVDFSRGRTPAGLANIATLVISNIACIKDHLKVWCAKNNKAFEGESLIDKNKNIALIHDLWNTEKHAELNRPPRSGRLPKLQNLRQALCVSAGTTAGSAAFFAFDHKTGEMIAETQGDGSIRLVISGQVVDERGVFLSDFAELCDKATSAWEEALIRAGITIPLRQ